MISSGLPTILFGLASAISWGSGDFCGGLASKRTSVYGVVVISQFVSLLLLVLISLLFPEGAILPKDILLGAVAGLFGATGLLILYSGLARGQMGIVAPVTALMAALVPVVFSIIVEGAPLARQIAGFVVALISVWLISKPGTDSRINLDDLYLPILAGIGFGVFFILIDQVSESAIWWPLVSARTTSIIVVFLIALKIREISVPQSNQIPVIILAGILDTGGNAFFALATRLGRLDIASILSSLYPAVTVLLAWIILKERLTLQQWIGVGLMVPAVALITL